MTIFKYSKIIKCGNNSKKWLNINNSYQDLGNGWNNCVDDIYHFLSYLLVKISIKYSNQLFNCKSSMSYKYLSLKY